MRLIQSAELRLRAQSFPSALAGICTYRSKVRPFLTVSLCFFLHSWVQLLRIAKFIVSVTDCGPDVFFGTRLGLGKCFVTSTLILSPFFVLTSR